jgi:hypothetical protein
MDETSQVPRKELLHVHKVSDCARFYDDQGNRMSPSFSVKNGVRYRFYVSSALLQGRKSAAGSVARIPAHEIEAAVETALRNRIESADETTSTAELFKRIDKVVVKADALVVTVRAANDDQDAPPDTITIPWLANSKLSRTHVPTDDDANMADQKLLQSVVRAHTWVNSLADGEYSSIEDLAAAVRIHPKVIRQACGWHSSHLQSRKRSSKVGRQTGFRYRRFRISCRLDGANKFTRSAHNSNFRLSNVMVFRSLHRLLLPNSRG